MPNFVEDLTPEEDKALQAKKIRDYYSGFPEAPASDSFKWVDPQGFNHLTTIRAWTPSNLIQQFAKLQVEIIGLGGKPDGQKVTPMPAMVQERDDGGLPVVDQDKNPVMVPAPANPAETIHAVKGFYHGISKANKSVLKCVFEGGGKYGLAVFDKPAALAGWEQWPAHNSKDAPTVYAPPDGLKHVVIKHTPGAQYPEEIAGFQE